MRKSPRFYKTIKSNTINTGQSLSMKVDPYKKIKNLLNKRAELMKKNEKFSQDICNILKEAAEEKMETVTRRHRTRGVNIFMEVLFLQKMRLYFLNFIALIGKENLQY